MRRPERRILCFLPAAGVSHTAVAASDFHRSSSRPSVRVAIARVEPCRFGRTTTVYGGPWCQFARSSSKRRRPSFGKGALVFPFRVFRSSPPRKCPAMFGAVACVAVNNQRSPLLKTRRSPSDRYVAISSSSCEVHARLRARRDVSRRLSRKTSEQWTERGGVLRTDTRSEDRKPHWKKRSRLLNGFSLVFVIESRIPSVAVHCSVNLHYYRTRDVTKLKRELRVFVKNRRKMQSKLFRFRK